VYDTQTGQTYERELTDEELANLPPAINLSEETPSE
jgi:hypothetical protein